METRTNFLASLILEQVLDEWKLLLLVLPFWLFLWLYVGEYHGAFFFETLWSLIMPPLRERYGVVGTLSWWSLRQLGVEVEDWGLGWVGPVGRMIGLKKQQGGLWLFNGLQKLICHLHYVSFLINVFLVGEQKTADVLHSSHLIAFNPQPVGEAEVIL